MAMGSIRTRSARSLYLSRIAREATSHGSILDSGESASTRSCNLRAAVCVKNLLEGGTPILSGEKYYE